MITLLAKEIVNRIIEYSSQVYFGITAPSNTFGRNNDVFINTTARNVYYKANNAWVLELHVPADDAVSRMYFDDTAPLDTFGNNNDVVIDTITRKMYIKTAGVWVEQLTIPSDTPAATPVDRYIQIPAYDVDVDVVSKTGIAVFAVPAELNAYTLTNIFCSVVTPSAGGAGIKTSVTLYKLIGGNYMLTSAAEIADGEYNNIGDTHVISGTQKEVATGELVRIDVTYNGAGSYAKGLYVNLVFSPPVV